jgi:hypothetical protein
MRRRAEGQAGHDAVDAGTRPGPRADAAGSGRPGEGHEDRAAPGTQGVLATSCAVAVEFVPGRLLRIEYGDDTDATGGCLRAREMVVVAVERLIQKSD